MTRDGAILGGGRVLACTVHLRLVAAYSNLGVAREEEKDPSGCASTWWEWNARKYVKEIRRSTGVNTCGISNDPDPPRTVLVLRRFMISSCTVSTRHPPPSFVHCVDIAHLTLKVCGRRFSAAKERSVMVLSKDAGRVLDRLVDRLPDRFSTGRPVVEVSIDSSRRLSALAINHD